MHSSKQARIVLRFSDDLRVRQASNVVLQAFGWGLPEEAAKRQKAEDVKQKEFNKQRAQVSGQSRYPSHSLQQATCLRPAKLHSCRHIAVVCTCTSSPLDVALLCSTAAPALPQANHMQRPVGHHIAKTTVDHLLQVGKAAAELLKRRRVERKKAIEEKAEREKREAAEKEEKEKREREERDAEQKRAEEDRQKAEKEKERAALEADEKALEAAKVQRNSTVTVMRTPNPKP